MLIRCHSYTICLKTAFVIVRDIRFLITLKHFYFTNNNIVIGRKILLYIYIYKKNIFIIQLYFRIVSFFRFMDQFFFFYQQDLVAFNVPVKLISSVSFNRVYINYIYH